MTQHTLSIRSPESGPEILACHDLLARVFGTPPDEHERVAHAEAWRERRAAWNELVPSVVRAAFRDGSCLGAYQIDERQLRLGAAVVRVGCIGAVATSPEHRNQGVATALMHDALAFAIEQGLGLLLLHGISDFYQRFGYANVTDLTYQRIALQQISALPPGDCCIRPATARDADALLDLYQRHQGCFVRTRALQRELLRQSLPNNPPVLALDRRGVLRGYMLLPGQADKGYVQEVGADTWDAALALLQYHAQLVMAMPGQATMLAWSLGLQSQTYYLLADQIRLESVVESIPNAEWMGRTASLPDLFASLLPAWRAHAPGHPAALRWEIGGEVVGVLKERGRLRCAPAPEGAPTIRLSQDVFTRLLLGYRPAAWAARQPGQEIPPALMPLIDRLLPRERLFVPKSDEF
jgi:predicted N-acetyltransferase YhbS